MTVLACGVEGPGDGTEPDGSSASVLGSTKLVDYTGITVNTTNFSTTYTVTASWSTSVPVNGTFLYRVHGVPGQPAPAWTQIVETGFTTSHGFSLELNPATTYDYQLVSQPAVGSTDYGPGGTFITPAGFYDVGVIAGVRFTTGTIVYDTACPSLRPLVIVPDNEDSSNANSSSGWVGGNYVSSGNWNLTFCRINGRKLFPLVTSPNQRYDYAVLQLGAACPNGSLPFDKYIDGEDDGSGGAYWMADSSPATMGPNAASGGNVHLFFCLFRSDPTTMSSFPDIGASYGVFAPTDFPLARATGRLYMDDEDSSNSSRYYSPLPTETTRIIGSGPNTGMYLSQVR
jgi:hypothetical protein